MSRSRSAVTSRSPENTQEYVNEMARAFSARKHTSIRATWELLLITIIHLEFYEN